MSCLPREIDLLICRLHLDPCGLFLDMQEIHYIRARRSRQTRS